MRPSRDPSRTDWRCRCHGKPGVFVQGWMCAEKRKAAQARYMASPGGKIARKAAQARYATSEKGKAARARINARRVGTQIHDYVGMAPTPEQAAELTNQIRAFALAQKGQK